MNTNKLPHITATHLARADKANRPMSADARPIGPRECKRASVQTGLTVYASRRLLRSGIEDLPPNVFDIATRGAITPYGMLGHCMMLDGERTPKLTRGYALRLALGSSHEWIVIREAPTPALTARRLTRAAAHRYSLFLERIILRALR